jgi:hypothetical protein
LTSPSTPIQSSYPTRWLHSNTPATLHVARTYAHVSAEKQGLGIVDVENPAFPKLDQPFTADGQLNDANEVKIGMVAGSAFAFCRRRPK